jgi:Tfp pilus assembly protein PilF
MLRILFIIAICVSLGCAGAQKKEEKLSEDAQFHYKMASAYFDSHEIPLAIKELTEALELDPDHKEAHYLMGFIYHGRRDYSKAIRHYQRALDIDPQYHFARNNLGTVYLATERWQDAVPQFEKLLEEPLYPTPELAHNNLGWALYQQGKYQRALEHFKMAAFLKPQLCLAQNNLGLTHKKMGNHDRAMEKFMEAVRLCPKQYAEPHFHIGKMMAEAGNPNARSHFEACARIEPGTNLGRRCREYLSVR